jgi:hypothetical protein
MKTSVSRMKKHFSYVKSKTKTTLANFPKDIFIIKNETNKHESALFSPTHARTPQTAPPPPPPYTPSLLSHLLAQV